MSDGHSAAEETFDGGFLPVSAELIEKRLAEIWRNAGGGEKADRGWSKLCLANTIVITDSRTRPEAETVAYALAELHPSRTLLIVIDDFPTYGAFVRTACRLHPETKGMICWEVIEILAAKERIVDIPGAIRSLVVPSIPVITIDFSPGQSPAELDRTVMQLSDFYLSGDSPFPSEQIHHAFLPFAWFATLPVREMLSTMFGHYQRNHPSIYPTGYEVATLSDQSHLLLGGWLLYRLGVLDSAVATAGVIKFSVDRRAATMRFGDLPISESSAILLRIDFSDGTRVEIAADRVADGAVIGCTGTHGDFRTHVAAGKSPLAQYVLDLMQSTTEFDEYHAAVAAARTLGLTTKE